MLVDVKKRLQRKLDDVLGELDTLRQRLEALEEWEAECKVDMEVFGRSGRELFKANLLASRNRERQEGLQKVARAISRRLETLEAKEAQWGSKNEVD